MKKVLRKPLLTILGAALMVPAALLAQPGEKDKDKEKDKKDGEVITIIRKGEQKEKVVVEVDGDKVTVNGKPLDQYEGDAVTVKRSKIKDPFALMESLGNHNWAFSGNADNLKMLNMESDRAMLGVTTEKADKGVQVQDVTKESGASKAGLKEGDVIIKIDDKKIETPDDLSKAIRSHKPGEKVAVTYLRDDKEQKVTAELGKWKGASAFSYSPGQYKLDLSDMDFDHIMPKVRTAPGTGMRTPYGQNWTWSGGSAKLGLSVQDTDDGKGVKVIEVDDESNANKAGIKVDDVITEVDGKAINSTDEIAKIIKESKDKTSISVKLLRGGKTQTIDVKIPRKIKTADL